MSKGFNNFDFKKATQTGFKIGGTGAFLIALGILGLNSFYYGTSSH